jgi:uncharacterized protein YndB with AHSA1/START domain
MKARSDERESRATLSFECHLDAPPAQVWRALTIPEFVARWLGASIAGPQADGSAREGVRESPSSVSLRLLDCEKHRFVRYAWREYGDPSAGSVVTFRLRPDDAGGTTFNIVHEMASSARALAREGAANGNAPPLLLAA